jgi:hypothetical protein
LAKFEANQTLYNLRIAPDEHHVAAWGGKTLHLLDIDGQVEASLEFAKSVTDVVFVSPTEVAVAAGSVEYLRFGLGTD